MEQRRKMKRYGNNLLKMDLYLNEAKHKDGKRKRDLNKTNN